MHRSGTARALSEEVSGRALQARWRDLGGGGCLPGTAARYKNRLTVTAPIAKLLCDAVEILGPTDPGVVGLEQNGPQVGDAVLALVLGEGGLIVSAAGCRYDAFGAREQKLDFLWGHLALGAHAHVGAGAGAGVRSGPSPARSCSFCRSSSSCEWTHAPIHATSRTEAEGRKRCQDPRDWVPMRDAQ